MDKKLCDIIEGILFVCGTSLGKDELAERLNVDMTEVEKAVEDLKTKFCGAINLLEFDGKIQLATNSNFKEEISTVLTPIKEREFSQSMLEVVSIVAYKQPITRLEIEQIRGVASEYAISSLLKQNIIEIVGKKDVLGRPYLFGTTENFLKKFNLNTVADLPNYQDFVDKLKTLNDSTQDDLLFEEE